MTDEQLQEKYLGKILEIPYNEPKHKHLLPNRITGKCTFIGHNPKFPSWDIQVTIGRMPLTNVDVNTIKIIK